VYYLELMLKGGDHLIPIGVYVDEYKPGDWRVFKSSNVAPPSGSMSETSYPSQEEALKAAKEGKFD
jgi:hypothetical protein